MFFEFLTWEGREEGNHWRRRRWEELAVLLSAPGPTDVSTKVSGSVSSQASQNIDQARQEKIKDDLGKWKKGHSLGL